MTSERGKDMAPGAWQERAEGTRRKWEYRKGGYSGVWCGIRCAFGVVGGGDSHRYSTLKS